ncbi:lipase member H-A-like isoform 2-T2 [Aphomia sociella]
MGVKGKSMIKKRYSYYQMKALANDPTMDYSKRTMMYVGGYLDNPASPPALIMQNEYSKMGYNVWLLDTNPFTMMEYPLAARLIRTVGKHVGEMLYNLTLHNVDFDPKKLELVGLSLGAQTMSFAAKTFKALSGTKLDRLTGLDPAGPCFRNLDPEQHLNKDDAEFIDVMIVNMNGLGMAYPQGHVNYYVSGGEYQPADVYWSVCDSLCSHLKTFLLWYTALRYPDSFIALQCDSIEQAKERNCYDRQPMVTNVLGLKVDRTKQGIFYLAITYNFPYYMGKEGLMKENEPYNIVLQYLNSDDVMVV